MNPNIEIYNQKLPDEAKAICTKLAQCIDKHLLHAESKIWHAHPVWFIEGNPIVGYSLQKKGLRLMFWSGASFDEPLLIVKGEKFKDASIFYHTVNEIHEEDLQRWLKKATTIQWDYKNIVKLKGKLQALTPNLK